MERRVDVESKTGSGRPVTLKQEPSSVQFGGLGGDVRFKFGGLAECLASWPAEQFGRIRR